MAKIDVSKIVSDMQKLYVKDKKIQSIITTADAVKSEYTEKDGIPLKKETIMHHLINLAVFPYNKIIEVFGRNDTGKSTIGAELTVAAQNSGHQVIIWDPEDKLDTHRLRQMGAKLDDILLIKTNETLKGGELVRKYIIAIKEQDPAATIFLNWDGIGGNQSRSHAERELDNEKHAQPGQDAKEIVSVMKTLISLFNKYPDCIAVYASNQVYQKMGFMQFGDSSSGGPKKDHYFSFRITLKQVKTLTKVVNKVKVKYGIVTRATVTKNHLSQGKTSIHQMDFIITAEGCKVSDIEVSGDEEDND